MISEIRELLAQIRVESDVAGVVVTGVGTAFSAGADLHSLQSAVADGAESSRKDSESFMQLLLDIHSFPKPVVAAVNGPALGGGCGLAAACDLVLASENAVFGYPEVRIGFIPALVSVFLTNAVGARRARELVLTGRTFSALEGERIGFVNKVVPENELRSSADEVIRLIAKNSSEAVASIKELLAGIDGLSTHEALRLAAAANSLSRFSTDFKEGVSAFLEKRSPDFEND